jgi:hypothetical protein|tara:strand:- start:134 stop:904 length:771 start_codon:yes stop_codon:yes gene_type:complete
MGKARIIKQLAGAVSKPAHKAYKPTSSFQRLAISSEFADNVNQPTRRAPRQARPRLPKDMAAEYRKYGQQLYRETGSLNNQMQVNYGGTTFDLKSNSTFLKSGDLSVKVRPQGTKTAQDARRQRMESEQTLGEDAYKKGHHRVELDLIDKVVEGLSVDDRFRFLNTIQKQFPNLVTGNEIGNLIGPKGNLPTKVHSAIHMKLREAGLDPRKMDFRTASYKQRLRFMREVEAILLDIDKYMFEGMRRAAIEKAAISN